MKKTTTLTIIAALCITAVVVAPAFAGKMSAGQRTNGFVKCMKALDMNKAKDGLVAGSQARKAAIKAGADYGIVPKWRVRGKKKKLIGMRGWVAEAWDQDPDVRVCLRHLRR